ncbi:MAG: hypothetical protein CMI74_05875 [Candidatus Pelagibacter sp.]|mgnify:CR=1 FL=1|nr:hypothetical protein [Candidatus Pelagibacter sp.]
MIDIIRSDNYTELYEYLLANNFEFLSDHNEIIYYAIIYKFVNNNQTAGFVWLYELEEPKTFNVHLHINKQFTGRTLTRSVVNKFYKMTVEYADKLIAEPIDINLIKLYKRIGWQQISDHSSQIKLPYQWRTKWDQ